MGKFEDTKYLEVERWIGTQTYKIVHIKIHIQSETNRKKLLPAHSSQSSVSLYLSGLYEPRKAGHALWPVTAALLGFDSWWFFVLAPGHHGLAAPKRKENSA